MLRWHRFVTPALVLLAVILSPPVHAQTFTATATLTKGGAPGKNAEVLGNATFAYDPEYQRLRFWITFRQDLFYGQLVAIYYGSPKKPGPLLFGLAGSAPTTPIEGAVYEYNLEPQPELGIATFEDAMNAIAQGKTFIKMDTPSFPEGVSGKIRR